LLLQEWHNYLAASEVATEQEGKNMRIVLVGQDEPTKDAIARQLADHYGFVADGIYRPFKQDLAQHLDVVAEQVQIKRDDWFGAVEGALRQALGPDVFLKAFAARLDAYAGFDVVVTDVICADEVERLQALGFHAVMVTSTNSKQADALEMFVWHSRIKWTGALLNDGTLDDLNRKINDMVAALAQAEGAASTTVRRGINNFRG